jgi:hypothetical protein
MSVPRTGGPGIHPALTPPPEPKGKEFQSEMKQVEADFKALEAARAKLQWAENHGATNSQIQKDKQTVEADAKKFAAAANRMWEQQYHMPAPLPPLSQLENPPRPQGKEMKDQVRVKATKDEASLQDRAVKG